MQKKMNLGGIIGKLSRSELKKIMAGSGPSGGGPSCPVGSRCEAAASFGVCQPDGDYCWCVVQGFFYDSPDCSNVA